MTKLSHQPMILVVTFLTFLIIGISTGKYLEVKIFGPDLYLQKRVLVWKFPCIPCIITGVLQLLRGSVRSPNLSASVKGPIHWDDITAECPIYGHLAAISWPPRSALLPARSDVLSSTASGKRAQHSLS